MLFFKELSRKYLKIIKRNQNFLLKYFFIIFAPQKRIYLKCNLCLSVLKQQSITLLQILISLWFPIHSSQDIHLCSRKKLFEFSEASIHWCLEKITSPKISAYFPAEHLWWHPFLSTLVGLPGTFPKCSLEQLSCKEPVSACFCKKELHSRCYLRNFPEI